MQFKLRLPNILSFIGRLGNMRLMQVGCQGPLASYPRARDPRASQSPAHGKTEAGKFIYCLPGPADSITRGSLDRGVNVPPCVSNPTAGHSRH